MSTKNNFSKKTQENVIYNLNNAIKNIEQATKTNQKILENTKECICIIENINKNNSNIAASQDEENEL